MRIASALFKFFFTHHRDVLVYPFGVPREINVGETSVRRRHNVGTTSVQRRYNVVVPGVPWGAQTLLQRFFYLVLRTVNFAELHPAAEESITEQPDATNRAPHILLCTVRFCFC